MNNNTLTSSERASRERWAKLKKQEYELREKHFKAVEAAKKSAQEFQRAKAARQALPEAEIKAAPTEYFDRVERYKDWANKQRPGMDEVGKTALTSSERRFRDLHQRQAELRERHQRALEYAREAARKREQSNLYKFDGNLQPSVGTPVPEMVNSDTVNQSMGKYKSPVQIQAMPEYLKRENDKKNWTVKNINAGLGQVNKALATSLYVITPTDFLGKYDPFKKVYEHYSKAADNYSQIAEESSIARGKGWATGGMFLQKIVSTLPNTVLSLISGGTSVAGTGIQAAQTGVSAAVKAMASNPMYWTSFLQMVGNDYEDAKKNGANELQATATAMIGSLINAGVEIGGGIETLPGKLGGAKTSKEMADFAALNGVDVAKLGKQSAAKLAKKWALSMLDEGKEEVVQGVISNAVSKLMYDKSKPFVSSTDENAVVNSGRMAQEFGMGAAVGGILGGGQLALSAAANKITRPKAPVSTEPQKAAVDTAPDVAPVSTEQGTIENKAAGSQPDNVVNTRYMQKPENNSNNHPISSADYYALVETYAKQLYDHATPEYRSMLNEYYDTEDAKTEERLYNELMNSGTPEEQKLFGQYNDAFNRYLNALKAENKAEADKSSQSAYEKEKSNAKPIGAESNNQIHFVQFEAGERSRIFRETGETIRMPIYSIAKNATLKQQSLANDCRRLGLNVTFFDSRLDGPELDINGAYRNGHIYINTKAENPYRTVLGHEVLHQIRANDEAAYNQLVNVVNSSLGNNNDFSQLDTDTQEEKLADIIGNIAENPKAYKEIFRQNQSLGQRILNTIRDVIAKLTTPQKGYLPYKSEFAEQLKGVESQLTAVMREAVANNAQAVQDGQTRYMFAGIKFGEQLKDWLSSGGKKNGSYNGEFFSLGDTPNVFINHGAHEKPMLMLENCVLKITGGKHSISLDELQKLPAQLAEPIMLFKSDYTDKSGKPKKGFVALTELKDKHGNDIIAAVHINVEHGRNIINKVASVYSKSDDLGNNKIEYYVKNQIEQGNLVDGNIKKAQEWFSTKGLQLPNVVQTILGTNSTIPQKNSVVNTQYMQNSEKDAKRSKMHAETESKKTNDIIDEHSRVDNYLRKTRTSFAKRVSDLMNVPNRVHSEVIKPLFNQAWKEYKQNGKLSHETTDTLFQSAYEHGRVFNETFYNTYKDLKQELRQRRISISEYDSHDIPDFGQFKKSLFNTLSFGQDGVSVDVLYEDLKTRYPELFPESVTSPSDRLLKIAEVAKSIKRTEQSLDDYAGDTHSEDFLHYLHNEFNIILSDVAEDFKTAKRVTDSKHKTPEAPTATASEIMQLYEDRTMLERKANRQRAKEMYDDKDALTLKRLLNGEISADEIPKDCNRDAIMRMLVYEAPLHDVNSRIEQYNKKIAAERNINAEAIIKNSDNWKDHNGTFFMSLTTMERNIQNIVGNVKEATAIINNYIRPVAKSEAEKVRFLNSYRQRVRDLKLTKEESYAVQYLGERRAELKSIEELKHPSSEKLQRKAELFKEIQEFQSKFDDLKYNKIDSAIKTFREIYDELFTKMNSVLVENGYAPAEYRRNYFPHFTENGDNILSYLGKLVGINTNVTELPGDLTGKTQNFKPGKAFFANTLARMGDTTTFDAVAGFDKYIQGASDVIYQTSNIRNLRALEESLRHKYSKVGVAEKIREINDDSTIAPEDKLSKINDLKNTNLSKHNALVNELNEYTNLIANKKSVLDRPWEIQFGRNKFYNAAKVVLKNVSANMIKLNLSSAASNSVALQQAGAEINLRDFMHGFYDTVKAYKDDDGFIDKSDFLTNRRGSEKAGLTMYEKFNSATDAMQFTDMLVSSIIVRARYYENMRTQNMSEAEALAEADSYANTVIAGRAKGQMPTRFSATNPLTKSYTMFQLEVANQLQNIFKDAPKRVLDRHGALGLAAYITKYLFGAFLYNELYKKIFGRKIAIDPLGMIVDAFETLTGQSGFETITDGINRNITYKDMLAAASGMRKDVLNITPFFGSLVGGGRIPFAITVPEVANVAEAINNLSHGEGDKKQNIDTILSDGVIPVTYAVNPFGGTNQLRKTYQGLSAVYSGGVTDNSGNLKYAIEQTKGNYIKGALFGVSALKDTRKYYEDNMRPFSAADNEEYMRRVDAGEDKYNAYIKISAANAVKTKLKSENPFIAKTCADKFIPDKKMSQDFNNVCNEIFRLNKAANVDLSFGVPDKTFEYDGKKIVLPADAYRKYVNKSASGAFDAVKKLVDTKYYKNAADDEKAELVKDMYQYARAVAKTEVSNYKLSGWIEKADYIGKTAKVNVAEYLSYAKQLPEKANEMHMYDLADKLGYDDDTIEALVNSRKFSVEQCRMIDNAGGFEYAGATRRLYSEMRSKGYDCSTVYVPVADKDFKYSNKKLGIKCEGTLNDEQMLQLQKVYCSYYEQLLKPAFKKGYRSMQDFYKEVDKIRSLSMSYAKRDYYYYLKKTVKFQKKAE